MRRLALVAAFLLLAGCATTRAVASNRAALGTVTADALSCSNPNRPPMLVHFINVEQALAVFVDLPDGQTILVDIGLKKNAVSDHVVDFLKPRLNGRAISMLWITHQHLDHLGGAPAVLGDGVSVALLVDNGREPNKATVKDLYAAIGSAPHLVVDPQQTAVPLQVTAPIELTAVVPPTWHCSDTENNCSIGLRVSYCGSSVLFTGDAEADEEATLALQPSTLLQVSHHGSDTSSTDAFLDAVKPVYAVISSGKRAEGQNSTYCHPRRSVVDRLAARLGVSDKPEREIEAFDFDAAKAAGDKCRKDAPDTFWPSVKGSDRLWWTVNGDISLQTTGDGVFTEVPTQ